MQNIKIQNLNVNLYNLNFKLKNITIFDDNSAKIIAETNNDNYMKLGNLFDNLGKNTNKENITITNNCKMFGVFLIDYNFSQYNIIIEFSADNIIGDIEQGLIILSRKEKLKKLYNIIN